MTTVSSVTPSSVNGYNTLSAYSNPVSQTSDSGLASIATRLSAEANIVATLGSGTTSSLTYDATGILNSFVQAGTTQAGSSTSLQTSAQNSTDQSIIGTLTSTPATSGVYNSSGLLQGISSNTTANWTTALKSNPALASSVITDSFNQGIVGTLSTLA
jgi:hypothetical protein